MANVYYGDEGYTAVTGNWNTVSNWFATVGNPGCCSPVPGTPLGRLPTAGDTVYITSGLGGNPIIITTAPTISYAGDLNSLNSFWCIQTSGVTWVNNVNLIAVTDVVAYQGAFQSWNGIFTGTFTLSPLNNVYAGYALKGSAAIWKGTWALTSGGTYNATAPGFIPISGTYAPNIAATINTTTGVITCTHPANPGFGAPSRASVYAPVITVSPLPSGGGVNGVTFPVTFK